LDNNNGQKDKDNHVNLEIGTRLFFKINGSKLSLKGIFVGLKRDKFIVARLFSPSISFDPKLFGGNTIVVYYIYQDMVYEFDTRFIRIVTDPVELILLEYPESVHIRELRSHKRIDCVVSADIQIKNNEKKGPIKGLIKDISKKGCRCVFQPIKGGQNPFHINEQIILTCHFPGITGKQKAFGRVRNIQKEKESLSVGIEFSEMLWWPPPYR
jgi:hypothetical protein